MAASLRDLIEKWRERAEYIGASVFTQASDAVKADAEIQRRIYQCATELEEALANFGLKAAATRKDADEVPSGAECLTDLQPKNSLSPEVCSRCGCPYRFDTSLPSVLWNAVIRAKNLTEYLCLTCIVAEFVRDGIGFTAQLYGDTFGGVPIEVRIGKREEALADADPAASSKEVAIRQFRMDELEAVMLSVDKWLDYAEDDPKKPNPATRACEAREVALRAIEKLQHQLAECYRLTGADPDCNEDWRLAELAVDEVRQLRADCDSEIGMGEERRYRQHKLEAEIDRLKLERAASSEGRATWQRELWQIGIGGNHLANALICLVGSAPWYDDLTELRGWTFDAMLARFGQPVTDMWVAWKAIMDLRDAIGEFPPAPVDGGR